MQRAFTLAELLVALSVIVIASSIAAPAIHSLHLHAQRAAAVQTFGAAVAASRATAHGYFTTTALRIERAFETDHHGQMVTDSQGNPRWLNHQQIRRLACGTRKACRPVTGEEYAFRQMAGTGVRKLPRLIWLAPGEALSWPSKGPSPWEPSTPGAAAEG